VELLVTGNPDPDSRLPYLIRVPVGAGLVFATSGTWPRMKALYCHPIPIDEWPAGTEVVERVELRSCRRRGAAIDVVATRARENRSQLVYTTARGREVVFWQSARTRKQSRPGVRVPSARAAGLAELVIVVDAHERYGYDFADKPVTTVRRGLSCGDYGLLIDGRHRAHASQGGDDGRVVGVVSLGRRWPRVRCRPCPGKTLLAAGRFQPRVTYPARQPAVRVQRSYDAGRDNSRATRNTARDRHSASGH